MSDEGCSCHLHPPCGFCTSMTEEEAAVYHSTGGAEAVHALRETRAEADVDDVAQAMAMTLDPAFAAFVKERGEGRRNGTALATAWKADALQARTRWTKTARAVRFWRAPKDAPPAPPQEIA